MSKQDLPPVVWGPTDLAIDAAVRQLIANKQLDSNITIHITSTASGDALRKRAQTYAPRWYYEAMHANNKDMTNLAQRIKQWAVKFNPPVVVTDYVPPPTSATTAAHAVKRTSTTPVPAAAKERAMAVVQPIAVMAAAGSATAPPATYAVKRANSDPEPTATKKRAMTVVQPIAVAAAAAASTTAASPSVSIAENLGNGTKSQKKAKKAKKPAIAYVWRALIEHEPLSNALRLISDSIFVSPEERIWIDVGIVANKLQLRYCGPTVMITSTIPLVGTVSERWNPCDGTVTGVLLESLQTAVSSRVGESKHPISVSYVQESKELVVITALLEGDSQMTRQPKTVLATDASKVVHPDAAWVRSTATERCVVDWNAGIVEALKSGLPQKTDGEQEFTFGPEPDSTTGVMVWYGLDPGIRFAIKGGDVHEAIGFPDGVLTCQPASVLRGMAAFLDPTTVTINGNVGGVAWTASNERWGTCEFQFKGTSVALPRPPSPPLIPTPAPAPVPAPEPMVLIEATDPPQLIPDMWVKPEPAAAAGPPIVPMITHPAPMMLAGEADGFIAHSYRDMQGQLYDVTRINISSEIAYTFASLEDVMRDPDSTIGYLYGIMVGTVINITYVHLVSVSYVTNDGRDRVKQAHPGLECFGWISMRSKNTPRLTTWGLHIMAEGQTKVDSRRAPFFAIRCSATSAAAGLKIDIYTLTTNGRREIMECHNPELVMHKHLNRTFTYLENVIITSETDGILFETDSAWGTFTGVRRVTQSR